MYDKAIMNNKRFNVAIRTYTNGDNTSYSICTQSSNFTSVYEKLICINDIVTGYTYHIRAEELPIDSKKAREWLEVLEKAKELLDNETT